MAAIHAHADTDSNYDVLIDTGSPPPVTLTRKSDGKTSRVGYILHLPEGIGMEFSSSLDVFSPEALRELALGLELYIRTKRLVDALNNDPQEATHG